MELKKYKKILLKVGVSAVLITIIIAKVDKTQLLENISKLNWMFVPLIVLLLVGNYVISSIRWKSLLIHGDADHVSVKYLISLYFIGSFFNNFMPTSIGGDVYKIYKLSKKTNNSATAFSATFMERFTGVLALIVLAMLGLIKYIGWWSVLGFIVLLLGAIFGLKILKFISKKISKLQKLYDALYAYKNEPKVVAYAFVTSFLVQLCSIFTQYFIYMSIGVPLPLFYSIMVFPVIILASFFIPSLNGIGVQEALYISMFSIVGVSQEVSLSASILFHLSRLGVSLIGGLLYALDRDN